MRHYRFHFELIKLALMGFLCVTIILPLINMFLVAWETNVGEFLTSETFKKAVVYSLITAGIATLISVTIATLLAWCNVRSGIKCKQIWNTIFMLPMLVPSISHGIGLILLFGANGVLTTALHLQTSIYGFWGIIAGSVMYSFPVAYLMVADILRYEDYTCYEAADVLGIPKIRQFISITSIYLRKPMISVVFAVFTMIITDYGVPLMVAGSYVTLPVIMYQDVIGLLDFGKGSVIGIILLGPSFFAFIVNLSNKDKGKMNFVTRPFEITPKIKRDAIAYFICGIAGLFILLPIAATTVLAFVKKYPINMTVTFEHIQRSIDMRVGEYLANSLVISLCVALVGVAVAFTTAYCTTRLPSRTSSILHLAATTSLAVPGIVLGLAYVFFFKGSFFYGTMGILILVNLTHFFSSPYLMMYNTLNKINENLEDVGMTLGVNRFRIVKDVVLPLSATTMIEMFFYFFANSMITISAISFLSNARNQPVSLMINMFEAQIMLECAAFVSVLLLGVNLIIKFVLHFVENKRIY